MDLFTEIRSTLLGLPAVMSLVAVDANTNSTARIWSEWQRTPIVPCIIIDIDTEDMQNDIAGHSDLTIAQVVITCRASSHAVSHSLWEATNDIATAAGTYQLIVDDMTHAATAKEDGSTDHWHDHVMDCTALFAETVG